MGVHFSISKAVRGRFRVVAHYGRTYNSQPAHTRSKHKRRQLAGPGLTDGVTDDVWKSVVFTVSDKASFGAAVHPGWYLIKILLKSNRFYCNNSILCNRITTERIKILPIYLHSILCFRGFDGYLTKTTDFLTFSHGKSITKGCRVHCI